MRIITTYIKTKRDLRGYMVVVDMTEGGNILDEVENIFESMMQLYEINN